MKELVAISRELDALQELLRETGAVTAREDDGRRHDLVQMRLKLSAQITHLGQTADNLFQSHPELLRTYRVKFSKMRSMTALHQASWPAVRLGEQEDEFRASAQRMREANQEFIGWMRDTLKQWS